MELEARMCSLCNEMFSKGIEDCTNEEIYVVLLKLVKEETSAKPVIEGDKKVYYFSAEFLIGKLMDCNLINLGIYMDVKNALIRHGKNLHEIEDIENEPSLGNGGLGRLAACFLDSIASLDLPGDGVGLNYHLGLFKQTFKAHKQFEIPNEWIDDHCWLNKTNKSYNVEYKDFTLRSTLYDIDIIGYKQGKNKLHLFDIDTVDESIVGDGIKFDKKNVQKNLTLFLYPDDSDEDGKKLRLYQQYFMVSNGAQMIIEDIKSKGLDLKELNKHVVIQINDTHPSMVIPELIRLLMKEGMQMPEAIEIVSKTCAYTNHTILAEALEKWPMNYFEEVVPNLIPIIKELDKIAKERSNNPKTFIIDDKNIVHMAHMDIHFGFSINGVAAIHTEILKNSELKDFYQLYPDKFNNKTNGISFRRWLMSCDEELSLFIDGLIGTEWRNDPQKLNDLMRFVDDTHVLDELLRIKFKKKKDFVDYIQKHENRRIEMNVESIFDVQIKRLHEYKRQQMNMLYVIRKYLDIKKGKRPTFPITVIFGAKAAPAYEIAKDIIHIILCLQDIINNDPEVSPYLKVVMIENYDVTYSEHLVPACDISEQISLASKEASGTGNMKLMLNGAVTLGTDDGANVEIHNLVGNDNIYIFGANSDTVIQHYERADYHPAQIYDYDMEIKEALDFIVGSKMMEVGDEKSLRHIYWELTTKDWFMTMLDLRSYIGAKDRAIYDYCDRKSWARKMLVNIAKSGYFSSDRTIGQYNDEIWKLK